MKMTDDIIIFIFNINSSCNNCVLGNMGGTHITS